jgi:transposase
MAAVVGIDVSKGELAVALRLGEKLKKKTFGNKPAGRQALVDWLRKQGAGEAKVFLEATGPYSEAVVEALHAAGLAVHLANPRAVHHFAEAQLRREKTDALDAVLLVDYGQALLASGKAVVWWVPPPPEVTELQKLCRRRQTLLEDRQQEANRLEATLPKEVVASIERHLAFLDAAIQDIERLIDEHIGRHPGLKHQRDLLDSIPGIAATTAALLLGELSKPFDSARQVAAFAGLHPSQRTSGSSVRSKPRLSKAGNAFLRRALYMPALVATRCNPAIRALCQRLKAKGLAQKAVIAAAMHKLLRQAFGVLKHGRPFNPALA